MMSQMEKRIPNYQGEYPIWLWWTEKPDLRCSGHFERGIQAVCLEVEIPNECILLSDFDAWHCVLNDSFCLLFEEEYKLVNQGTFHLTKEKSWERIFDLQAFLESSYWNNSLQEFQGVTGKLEVKHVKKVRSFKAR